MVDDEDAGLKTILSIAWVIIGAPSLPISGGTSATVILGGIAAIWGINWGGGEE
jgi:hypothetical protein